MAKQDTFFDRIRRLFSTSVIVRNVGGKKLKIVDTDKMQVGSRKLMDRYTRMFSTTAGYGGYMGYSGELAKAQRISLFRDYEAMDDDSILSSALDVYADESTMKSEYGNVLEIKSNNNQIKDILHNLFYDILNIEFNLWPWIRNLVKYGDLYLHLNVQEKWGIINVEPLSPYDVSRIEGWNPENPQEVKFILDTTDPRNAAGNAPRTEFENFEIAHFRMLSDSNYLPYGKSMIEGARKTWKQLSLMEDAMLIHRIMRAPEKRIFKIDIGNLPPSEVDTYMKRIIDKMKKAPVVDETTGDYNLQYNMQNLTEDFYLPVRGGDSGTAIESLPGLTYEAVEDIEYLRNKLLAALKIPKAFLGYEEQVGSKATLAAEDVRFARTIERIQRIVVSELTKIAVAHLYSQGFTDSGLVDFDLILTNPSTIYEHERLDLWDKKSALADSMSQAGLVSSQWVYDNIFLFSDEEVAKLDQEVIADKKANFRLSQIEMEGNDPVQSGQAIGTPYDMATAMAPEGTPGNIDQTGDEGVPTGAMFDEEEDYKSRKKVMKKKSARRDVEDRSHYGGVRDVLGKHDYANVRKPDKSNKIRHKYRKSPLALSHLDKMKTHYADKEKRMITEVDKIEEEFNDKKTKTKKK